MALPARTPPAASDAGRTRRGGLRQRVRRLGAAPEELAAQDLRQESAEVGAMALAQCCMGERVTVAGRLRAVTLRPHGGVPALEAELYDGSATVRVVWLGRRRIAGIAPGATLVVHGRLTAHNGVPTIFNPSYELHA